MDGQIVYYPLRMTASIDFLLLGDMIFRFSQDREWLRENLPAMRRAALYIEGWIDDAGLLQSHSYDLDQVYRDIDGVAQASACWAFKRLADLESAATIWGAGGKSGEPISRRITSALALMS